VNQSIKYLFYGWNDISNDDCFSSVMYFSCLVHFTSDSKNFSFWEVNIHCIINGFANDIIALLNVGYQDSDIVFDAHVYDNEYNVLIIRGILIFINLV